MQEKNKKSRQSALEKIKVELAGLIPAGKAGQATFLREVFFNRVPKAVLYRDTPE